MKVFSYVSLYYVRTVLRPLLQYFLQAMANGLAGDAIDKHAGWRCKSWKFRYVVHSLPSKLLVSSGLLPHNKPEIFVSCYFRVVGKPVAKNRNQFSWSRPLSLRQAADE